MNFTSRSQHVATKRCAREGFWAYHYLSPGNYPDEDQAEDGQVDISLATLNFARGIQSLAVSVPLTMGIWVHEGLAQLLRSMSVRKAVESAKEGALAAFGLGDRLLVSPAEENRLQRLGSAYSSEILQWTIAQELALVEGIIRAFERRVLPVFRQEWEILEVEREGPPLMLGEAEGEPLLWQWRPDGVLLHQTPEGPEIVVLNFKTASTWGKMQRLQLSRDDQSVSEIWALDKAMGYWHSLLRGDATDLAVVPPWYLSRFRDLPYPPKVSGMQLAILLKGRRMEDKKEKGKYVQYSPLIRGYCQPDPQGLGGGDLWAWSWDVPKVSKTGDPYIGTLGNSWKARSVWDNYPGGVEGWIDLLASGNVQPECGDALLSQFVFPELVPKREEVMESWARQMTLRELKAVESAAECNRRIRAGNYLAAINELEKRFPQTLGACVRYGSVCSFDEICFGSPQTLLDPMATGLYRAREAHHELEGEE